MNAVYTAALTLAGGVVLFVLNQWVQKFFFEPLHEQKQIIGEIDFLLILWASSYVNPIERGALSSEQRGERERGSQAFREAASRLIATTNAVRGYGLARILPTKADAREAARCLIGISNSMFSSGEGARRETTKGNREWAAEVRRLLRLEADQTGP